MKKDVREIVNLIASATGTRLFHQLKKANPNVSDQRLTSVVIFAMCYAKLKGLQIK